MAVRKMGILTMSTGLTETYGKAGISVLIGRGPLENAAQHLGDVSELGPTQLWQPDYLTAGISSISFIAPLM